jgi:hypothetical protein
LARLNTGANPAVLSGGAPTTGLVIATRNGNSEANFVAYKNKTSIACSNTGNTTGIPNLNLFICAKNGGSAQSISTKQLSLAFAGKHITTAMRDVIVDAFEKYMDANGKGVIS